MPASVFTVGGVLPAREVDPARFGALAPDYLTTHNASSRAAVLYGPPGTFDPAVLAFDEQTRDLLTTGEEFTFERFAVAAPGFTGDVVTFIGEKDPSFCDPSINCQNVEDEGQFYPNAKSVEFGERDALHEVASWLTRHDRDFPQHRTLPEPAAQCTADIPAHSRLARPPWLLRRI